MCTSKFLRHRASSPHTCTAFDSAGFASQLSKHTTVFVCSTLDSMLLLSNLFSQADFDGYHDSTSKALTLDLEK